MTSAIVAATGNFFSKRLHRIRIDHRSDFSLMQARPHISLPKLRRRNCQHSTACAFSSSPSGPRERYDNGENDFVTDSGFNHHQITHSSEVRWGLHRHRSQLADSLLFTSPSVARDLMRNLRGTPAKPSAKDISTPMCRSPQSPCSTEFQLHTMRHGMGDTSCLLRL